MPITRHYQNCRKTHCLLLALKGKIMNKVSNSDSWKPLVYISTNYMCTIHMALCNNFNKINNNKKKTKKFKEKLSLTHSELYVHV